MTPPSGDRERVRALEGGGRKETREGTVIEGGGRRAEGEGTALEGPPGEKREERERV